MRTSRFHLAAVAGLLAIPAHAAVVVDSASVAWSYSATDSRLGLVGQGSSLGFVDVVGNVSEGAGPNLDPTATSISVFGRTTTSPDVRLQGIISDDGGGVDANIGLGWYAKIVDPKDPNATGPVDITISGSYSLGLDGPGSDFNGDYDLTDGFAYLYARASASAGGGFLFSYEKAIGNDPACLPYSDPSLCEITISASDGVSVDATVALNSLIKLDLSAQLSLSGAGDGNYAARVRADPSLAFKNAVDADRYQIIFSSNLDPSVPTSPVPEPPTYSLLVAGLGSMVWAARRRRSAL